MEIDIHILYIKNSRYSLQPPKIGPSGIFESTLKTLSYFRGNTV